MATKVTLKRSPHVPQSHNHQNFYIHAFHSNLPEVLPRTELRSGTAEAPLTSSSFSQARHFDTGSQATVITRWNASY